MTLSPSHSFISVIRNRIVYFYILRHNFSEIHAYIMGKVGLDIPMSECPWYFIKRCSLTAGSSEGTSRPDTCIVCGVCLSFLNKEIHINSVELPVQAPLFPRMNPFTQTHMKEPTVF